MLKKKGLLIGGICILFIGLISLGISVASKHTAEGIDFENASISEADMNKQYMDYLEKYIAYMLEQMDGIINCDIAIGDLEDENVQVTVMVTVAAKDLENESLQEQISKCISCVIDTSTENITVAMKKSNLPVK